MRIIAVADLHGNLPQDIPECNLLIIAGDICPHFDSKPGSPKDIEGQRFWLESMFRPWLVQQPARYKSIIWGNHDFIGEHDPPNFDCNLSYGVEQVLLLDGQYIRIGGTPYTPRFFDWAFMETEEQLKERYARIPEGLDILITHGPPLWVCDRPAGDKGDHVGSKALYERLSTMNKPPKLHICGHIHGGKGEGFVFGEHGSVHVWNVAGVDEAYTQHSPMWTEIKLVEKEDATSGVSV